MKSKRDVTAEFVERLNRAGLPTSETIVIGSGAMALKGLRAARDIDVVVTDALFQQLAAAGWKRGKQGSSSYALIRGDVEVWMDWSVDGTGRPTFEDLLPNTQLEAGIRFVTLVYLRQRKLERGTEKDKQDVELIDDYLSKR